MKVFTDELTGTKIKRIEFCCEPLMKCILYSDIFEFKMDLAETENFLEYKHVDIELAATEFCSFCGQKISRDDNRKKAMRR